MSSSEQDPQTARKLSRTTGDRLNRPEFKITFTNTEHNVAVDERCAIFHAQLIVDPDDHFDWKNYQLEQVKILLDVSKIPMHVTIDEWKWRQEADDWQVLHDLGSTVIEERGVRDFNVEIRTGIFAAIHHKNFAKGSENPNDVGFESYIKVSTLNLKDYPQAESREHIEVRTSVQCVVMMKRDSAQAQRYGAKDSPTFTIDVD